MTLAPPPAAPAELPQETRLQGRHGARRLVGLGLLIVALVGVCFVSITLGSRSVTLMTIWDAFTGYDPTSASETVVREMRVPRTLLGLSAGAALGLSGAILQGVTRNPLAEPGIMGINTGASAFIVFGIMVLGTQQLSTYIWFGFLGAAVATVLVYTVASFGREGATPVKLALAGAAVTAAFYSLTNAIVMTNVEALNELRFWQVGSLAGRYLPVFWQTLPFIALGVVVALGTGRALNGLALGEDVAVALGQRVRLTRAVMFVTVALLCGAATAACGPIVFIGLVVPHLARMLCGPDYRWILTYSLVLTPMVLLIADIIGRVVVAPSELQVGVVLGVLGAPAFVALVRYRNLVEL
jgi:iron complex transport system permease protein